jgi:membrane fusion protein, adhesin transport system
LPSLWTPCHSQGFRAADGAEPLGGSCASSTQPKSVPPSAMHRSSRRSFTARGRVQQLLQRSPGEVVRPGDAVAKIVPLGDALVAEVLVKPEDIAAVKEGDKAELKVTAYDFSKYGKIKGEVSDISPTTFEQDDKRYYYKVHIRFNPNRSDRFATVWRLQPGMTVDADIISGSKSLLQYLLKPIYRGVDVAFSEH